jgi:hypothetical protein
VVLHDRPGRHRQVRVAGRAGRSGLGRPPGRRLRGRGPPKRRWPGPGAQAALFEATPGFWPPEYGGQGLSNREQVVFNQESEQYDLPVSRS